MRRITYLIFLSIIMSSVASFAHTDETINIDTVPEAIWNNRTEYKASEKRVVQYLKDIENDPVSDLESREKLDYIIRWVLGCPYVSLELRSPYFEKILTDEEYQYADYTAYTLLFGEVLYFLENPFDRDKSNAFRSGIYYVMNVYKKLKLYDDATTCQTLELFIRLDENNTLNKFIVLDENSK